MVQPIHVAMRRFSLSLIMLLVVSCGKKVLSVDDAEKPAVFTLNAPVNVTAVELEVSGLLSGPAQLYLFRPQDNQRPWKTLEFVPVVVSGIPMGITPIRFHEKYAEPQLILEYEPGRKTQGHLEIQYRFKSR